MYYRLEGGDVKILAPAVPSEDQKRILTGEIIEKLMRNLDKQLSDNLKEQQVSFYLGRDLEFTKDWEGQIGTKDKEKELIFESTDELKRYINSILDIAPTHFELDTQFVYDVIPKRQAHLADNADMERSVQDPEKLERLFSACAAVCRNRGLAVLMGMDDMDSSQLCYYQKEPDEDSPYDKNMADRFPKGLLAFNSGFSYADMCSLILDEMAYAGMYQNVENELQAHAVSNTVKSMFGIEDTSIHFTEIDLKDFEPADVYEFFAAIHKDEFILLHELKNELGKDGYNLSIAEIDAPSNTMSSGSFPKMKIDIAKSIECHEDDIFPSVGKKNNLPRSVVDNWAKEMKCEEVQRREVSNNKQSDKVTKGSFSQRHLY